MLESLELDRIPQKTTVPLVVSSPPASYDAPLFNVDLLPVTESEVKEASLGVVSSLVS